MIPRVGERVRRDQTYGLRHGVYAILQRGADVLLTHQAGPDPEFQLPGGGIDPGEQVLQALHREVLEETGWRIGRAVRLGVYRRFTYMPDYDRWAEKVCHIYRARPVHPLGAPSEEGHSAQWVPIDLAADLVASAGDGLFLRALTDRG